MSVLRLFLWLKSFQYLCALVNGKTLPVFFSFFFFGSSEAFLPQFAFRFSAHSPLFYLASKKSRCAEPEMSVTMTGHVLLPKPKPEPGPTLTLTPLLLASKNRPQKTSSNLVPPLTRQLLLMQLKLHSAVDTYDDEPTEKLRKKPQGIIWSFRS